MKGLVKEAGLIFSTNLFNSSLETKISWFCRMDEDLTATNSAPRPALCFHWRLTTEDWILTYCKKGGMNSVAIMIPSISLIITVRQYVEVTIKWSRAGI